MSVAHAEMSEIATVKRRRKNHHQIEKERNWRFSLDKFWNSYAYRARLGGD